MSVPGSAAALVSLREILTGRAWSDMERASTVSYNRNVVLDEPLLTAADVARLLAIPPSSVYEYARRPSNPLPSIGVGRHRRFYRSHVEHWLSRLRP